MVVGGNNLTKAARVGVKKEAIIEEDKTLMCGEVKCMEVLIDDIIAQEESVTSTCARGRRGRCWR